MKGCACFFMALAAFFAGVIIGSRFLPSGGSIGCGNKIINCFDAKRSERRQ